MLFLKGGVYTSDLKLSLDSRFMRRCKILLLKPSHREAKETLFWYEFNVKNNFQNSTTLKK